MTRPTAEEIEKIRKYWAGESDPDDWMAIETQQLLTEIDALREENQRLQKELHNARELSAGEDQL